jgi:hypothetical protein
MLLALLDRRKYIRFSCCCDCYFLFLIVVLGDYYFNENILTGSKVICKLLLRKVLLSDDSS